MRLNKMKKTLLLTTCLMAFGCSSASEHAAQLHSTAEREMTVGIVQREIRPGMSAGEVADALGSPNIVTRDKTNRETWVYDKIATQASYSNSQGGVAGGAGVAAVPGAVLLLGLLGGNYSESAGASATTQKTLTVVIRFDQDSRVSSATFHASTF